MKRFLLVAFFVLMVAPSLASDRFAHMDANHDNAIVWEEFEAAMPQMRRQAFDIIDTNKDGRISREEWNAFSASHGAPDPHQKNSGPNAQNGTHPDKPLINPPTK